VRHPANPLDSRFLAHRSATPGPRTWLSLHMIGGDDCNVFFTWKTHATRRLADRIRKINGRLDGGFRTHNRKSLFFEYAAQRSHGVAIFFPSIVD
jgi:hypothetical protein